MSTTPSRLPSLLSIDKVAKDFDVSTKTIRRWIKRGDLASHRLGRQIRIAEPDLIAFLAKNKQ